MKARYILAVAFIAALTACTAEISGIEEAAGIPGPDIYASQEGAPESKTLITTEENVSTIWWSPGDQINIFYGTLSTLYTAQNTEPATTTVFRTTDIIGSNEGSADGICGLYPYNANATCDGSSISTSLPATQLGVPETFDDDLFITVSQTSTTNHLKFYNVCGGIKFSLSRDDIKSITFKGNNGEDLAGGIRIAFEDGLPAATVTEGQKTVTLTPKDGATFEKGVNYYIVLLPVTLTDGFTMTFNTATQTGTFEYTDGPVTIKRSVFSKKEEIDSYASFGAPEGNIEFEDELVKELCVANWDTDGDGELSYAKAAAVTDLGEIFRGQAITKFDELQYFTGLTSIGSFAFQSCSNLTSIVIPDGVTSIEFAAFNVCTSLTTIVIPESVTSIWDGAFCGCSSLTSIVIPEGVISIGEGAFADCNSLSEFKGKFISEDGRCLIVDENLVAFAPYGLSSYSIPEGVTSIGGLAFDGCTSLTSIEIPEGVTSIGDCAFGSCSSLTSIEIPESVTSIGGRAFTFCTSLTSIVIPEGVTSIGQDAFSRCFSLTSIECKAVTPPGGGSRMFDYTNNCPIYVPAGSVDAYKAAAYWSDYADRIFPIEGIVPKAIDLGLPSGLKWASFNIGATAPEEYGDYFAWGETEPKNVYAWYTYKWCNGTNTTLTKYNKNRSYGTVDGKTVLDQEDDVAQVKLGSKWRMPTSTECMELVEKCNWTWTTMGGHNGYKVTSNENGNSIFLPVAGWWYNSSLCDAGSVGNYWSSSLCVEDDSWYIYLNSDTVKWSGTIRAMGGSVRPVFGDWVSATSVSMNRSTLNLEVGKSATLTATVLPSNASDKSIAWSSSDISIATVASDGVVTALKAGTTTITVTTNDGSKTASCALTVIQPDGDLSDGGLHLANCYVVSASGRYSFPADVAGNDPSRTLDVSSVGLLWQTLGTASYPSGLVTNVEYLDGYAVFTVPEPMQDGNVVIAAYNSAGTIVWSWHIWLCSNFDPELKAHTYFGGAVVMDRNLGATSATPGDVKSLGLLYQWGRKDPFPASRSIKDGTPATTNPAWPSAVAATVGGSLNYVIQNPMVFVYNSTGDWLTTSTTETLWGAQKALYDPCPYGWKVPEGGATGLWASSIAPGLDPDGNYTLDATYDTYKNGFTLSNVFSASTIWLPCVGYRAKGNGDISNQAMGYYYTSSLYNGKRMYSMALFDGDTNNIMTAASVERAYACSIRCVKE